MRNHLRTLLSAVAVCAIAVVAYATSPHFISASDAIITTATSDAIDLGDLVVSWKEAGLGNNLLIDYTASASGTAEYACINGGGNHPSASNKETVNGPVSASGTFTSGKNGSISGSLTVEEPGPGAFSCPPGQTFILAFVAYSNISLADISFNDSAAATPSSLSACFV